MADVPAKLTSNDELSIGEFWQIKHCTGDTLANIYLKEGYEILSWKVRYYKEPTKRKETFVEYLLGKKEKRS